MEPHHGRPPPCIVEELDASFVVRDRNGQKLAYIYFEDEPRPDRTAARWDVTDPS
jgi:hypothetical protein